MGEEFAGKGRSSLFKSLRRLLLQRGVVTALYAIVIIAVAINRQIIADNQTFQLLVRQFRFFSHVMLSLF